MKCRKAQSGLFYCLKICIIVIISIVYIFSLSFNCWAEEQNVLRSEDISAFPGEYVDIPVMISGNNGFMGFGIEVNYDSTCIKPIEIDSGKILATGLFNDNISETSDGSFKIIYTNTQNIENDGELFVLRFYIMNASKRETDIELCFISDDCFNEKWKEVSFNCKNIKLSINNKDSFKSENTVNSTCTTNSIDLTSLNRENIVRAIKSGLNKFGYVNINKIHDEQKKEFVNYINEQLNTSFSTSDDVNNQFNELESIYLYESSETESEISNQLHANNSLVWIFIVVMFVAFLIVFIIIIKMKNRQEGAESEKNNESS